MWRCVLIGCFLVACGGTAASGSTGQSTGTTASTTGVTGSTSSGTAGTTTGGGAATTGATSGGASTSSSGGATTGGGTGGFVIAPHNPLPQVPDNGESVIAHPAAVLISYAGYPYDVAGYAESLLQSSWMSAVGLDYGVGLGTVAANTVLDGGAPAAITDAQITDLIAALIFDGGVPKPTSSTIYFATYPQNTVITSSGSTSCQQFGGYHSHFLLDGGSTVVYAVLATCPGGQGSIQTTQDLLQIDFSHELIEAATDPIPAPPRTGFAIIDPYNPWTYSYGEVADLCEVAPAYVDPDGGWQATRVWSNHAASVGAGSPCIPSPPGEIYYSVSVDPDTIAIVDAGSQDQTITFQVTGWSTGPMDNWALYAMTNGYGTFGPSVQLDSSSYPIPMNNGITATMSVLIPGGTGAGNLAGIALYSYVSTGASQTDFFGAYAMAAVYAQ